jgi:type IV pilus assembly protein PilB
MAIRLGELLLREKRVTPAQLQEALNFQKANGGRLAASLVKLGILRDEDITSILSRQYGVPSINLTEYDLDPAIVRLVPGETATKHNLIPVGRNGTTLTLAMTDPTNIFAMDEVKFITGLHVEPVVASETAIRDAVAKYFAKGANTPPPGQKSVSSDLVSRALEDFGSEDATGLVEVMGDAEEIDAASLEKQSGEAPIIRLVNALMLSAIQKGASDIHVEPYEKDMRIRFRIDGVLQAVMAPALKYRDPIISRIKIMARLDIAEKRLPQDGRIKARFNDQNKMREIDFRVSCLPTLFGEKVVMRLLDAGKLQLDMTKLGFGSEALGRFEAAIKKPWGMVLVTGPTGSGKTNTLYSALSQLNVPGVNIMTAEDPVEFNLQGVNQVLVKESIGLNFAAVLRSFLRQDPNIILVGEIRDGETAGIGVKAALTGHLVLSTLHTNDAPSSVNRMVNMGIEPFLVANAVNLVVAQRLVRRICDQCKKPAQIPMAKLIEAGWDGPTTATQVGGAHGRGCDRCGGTGYKGRVGLFEVMEMSEPLRELVIANASVLDLKKRAVEEGMMPLRQAGLRKVAEGMTTIEEVVRETI